MPDHLEHTCIRCGYEGTHTIVRSQSGVYIECPRCSHATDMPHTDVSLPE